MAELEKGKPVSLEELMLATLAPDGCTCKATDEKGVITDAAFEQKLFEERPRYQRSLITLQFSLP